MCEANTLLVNIFSYLRFKQIGNKKKNEEEHYFSFYRAVDSCRVYNPEIIVKCVVYIAELQLKKGEYS